jgi:flagellar biosynthesis protein FlhB
MKYVIKTKNILTISFLSIFLLFGVALMTHAEDLETPGAGCDPATQLCNPLKAETIIEFIVAVIDVLLIFAVPIIVLFIMYAGFLFVTARGNEAQISKAKSALLWAVVGGVIALAAKLIIEVITGTITALGA